MLKTRILLRPGCFCTACVPCSWDLSPGSLLPVPTGRRFRKQGGESSVGYLSHPPLWCLIPPSPVAAALSAALRYPQALQSREGHPAPHASPLHLVLGWKWRQESEKDVPEMLPLSPPPVPHTAPRWSFTTQLCGHPHRPPSPLESAGLSIFSVLHPRQPLERFPVPGGVSEGSGGQ